MTMTPKRGGPEPDFRRMLADCSAAIAAIRGVLADRQQSLPDELADAVTAAGQAFDEGCPDEAARLLGEALEVAAEQGFM